MDGKTCVKCKLVKPVTEFYPRQNKYTKIRSDCKSCCRARRSAVYKEYTAREKERSRKSRAKTLYNLTSEQYDTTLKIKNCQICGANDKLCIDHDHATGKFRGVLCRACNMGLGMFKDDVTLMARAEEYLNAK